MHLSLNWLKDFVDLPKKIDPRELGRLLTLHTVEIESAASQADKFDKIIVGKILEVKKHPNADRLQLALVDSGKEKLEIVCGAPNIKPGQMVPLALIGAVMPNGLEIKEVDVRGIKSQGMLSAPDELGLGEDHSGILILDKKAKLGQSFSDYLGLYDVILEVDNKSITHRPDLWSHLGIAREISAFLNVKLTKKADKLAGGGTKITADNKYVDLKVKVLDEKLCPRYMAVALDRIKIAQSPKWMEDRLVAAGVRPVNNIVDVTNYVMLEIGQPMHAFDLVKICPGGKDEKIGCEIKVRRAAKGEVMMTLDGKERELHENMLVIADKEKAIAVAGVMGGGASEISSDTDSIVLESASFDYISIRKTSRDLGLRSESSMRFEKSLDPNLAEAALSRAVELIKEICPGARVVSQTADEKNFKLNTSPLKISLNWLNEKVGQVIDWREIERILKSLGFGLVKKGDELTIAIPSWRATRDISIKEDIVEEVARIHGYEKLAPALPEINLAPQPKEKNQELKRRARKILYLGARLTEIYNYSFVGEAELAKLNIEPAGHIKLLNPIASNQALLRQSLTPNLIENIRKNQSRYPEMGIFEIGNIFSSLPGDLALDDKGEGRLPFQEECLGIVVYGTGSEELFLKIKGIITYLLFNLGLPAKYVPLEEKPGWMDKNAAAGIEIGEVSIGSAGVLDGRIAKASGIKREAAIAEISLKKLENFFPPRTNYREIEKYPSVIRDLSFVLPKNILYNKIKDEIENFSELIKSVELFDVYEGEKFGAGKKSLAFQVYYSAQRTLTSEEVEEVQKKLVKHLEDKFEAKLRDF
ncbi:MAG: phenylalanine--tRNA ligase subunit beta [Patescibacteria group bacterium]|jgi:phenylalanyl-tRNA synthetase beta chain